MSVLLIPVLSLLVALGSAEDFCQTCTGFGDMSCEFACNPVSLKCACLPGEVCSASDGSACVPENGCIENNGGCDQICTPQDGGAVACSCEDGFELVDDKCVRPSPCRTNARQLCGKKQCQPLDAEPFYSCVKCARGSKVSKDGLSCVRRGGWKWKGRHSHSSESSSSESDGSHSSSSKSRSGWGWGRKHKS